MQKWPLKYYDEAAQAKIAERGKTWSPELQEQVEAVAGVDPGCGSGVGGRSGGRERGRRWRPAGPGWWRSPAAIRRMSAGLKKLYADKPTGQPRRSGRWSRSGSAPKYGRLLAGRSGRVASRPVPARAWRAEERRCMLVDRLRLTSLRAHGARKSGPTRPARATACPAAAAKM